MNVGDIIRNPDTSAKTGLTTWEEIIVTQEMVDKAKAKAKADKEQARIDKIYTELDELDKIISRVEEDIIKTINLELHPSKQAILDRKEELRAKL